MPKPLEPIVKLARENERLKIDNSNLRSLNKKLLRRGGGYDDFVSELRGILSSDDTFDYKTAPGTLPDPNDEDHEEIACVPVSDLHLTENVRLEDTNGINVYNSGIAANRLWEHCQKVKSILTRHAQMYKLKSIWSALLGDIINGSIHAEMIPTNDLSDPSAVVLASRLMFMFYSELKTLGLPIEIDTIVGNHPRMTVKMPTKRQTHTNLDWLIYENLADRFEKDDQVKITVHTSQIGMKKLYGFRYIFEHGIDVQNGKEEDLEDRLRALFDDPTFRQATGLVGSSLDQVLVGNLHTPKFLQRTIVNGCYTGQSELGMSWRLRPIRAVQLLWGVTKKHCRTWEYMVDMTHIKSDKPTNPFSEYCAWFIKRHGRT